MMRPPSRSIARGLIRVLLMALAVLVLLPFCGLMIVIGSIGGRIARYRMVMWLTPIFSRVLGSIAGLRLTVRGEQSPGSRVFAGNHVSYLDILVAGAGIGGVFVSRHDVKHWPVIGLFARMAGTVFIDRGSLRSAIASSAGIVERAGEGIRIALFPEGGTTSGEGVGEFKPFLFSAICREGLPVQPFTIRYLRIGDVPITAASRDLVYWYDPAPSLPSHGWRLLTLRNVHVEIEFHPPLQPAATGGINSVRDFVERLREAVAGDGEGNA
jgi:1-acyl-sn-glycerol-3-phosphate acyltransferase